MTVSNIVFEKFAVVAVPHPIMQIPFTKFRPAVVISSAKYNEEYGSTVICMVTSAQDFAWHDDIKIRIIGPTGLPVDSYIRPKIFTIDIAIFKKQLAILLAKILRGCRQSWGKWWVVSGLWFMVRHACFMRASGKI